MCDGQINCENADDEKDCPDDGRFYCEEGDVLFVTKEKVDYCINWKWLCKTVESDRYGTNTTIIYYDNLIQL